MKHIQFITTALFLYFPLSAIEDTEANRVKAADRYLAATPISELMTDMVEKMGENQPPEKQAWIKNVMTNLMDFKALEKIMKTTMTRTFTADELNALADFYSSPSGKSAMKKFGTYMAATMPPIQAEVMKAIEKSKTMMAEPNAPPRPL